MADGERPARRKHGVKVLLVQGLAIAAAVLAAWMLLQRNQPERLLDLSAVPHYDTLSNGTMFRTEYRDTVARSGPMILSRPVRGGPERMVVAEDPANSFYSTWETPEVVKGAVIYGVIPYRKRPTQTPTPYGGSVSNVELSPSALVGTYGLSSAFYPLSPGLGGRRPISYRGLFAAPKEPDDIRRGQSDDRRSDALYWRDLPWIRFRAVPVSGGEPRDLVTLQTDNVKLVGRYAFWIRSVPDEETLVTRGDEEWMEQVGSSELYLTNLTTGAEKRIDGGLPAGTTLTRGESGVFWARLRPYPDTSRDLFYCSAATGRVLPLGQLRKGVAAAWPVELSETLYWFVVGNGLDDRLMAADLDGGNVRPISGLADLRLSGVPGRNLGVYHGSLFCLVRDISRRPLERAPVLLTRIQPARPNPFEVVRKLPPQSENFNFDDGYLYYDCVEAERGLIQSLTGDDAGGRLVNPLYRIPLP
jgi:hypothetical protein